MRYFKVYLIGFLFTWFVYVGMYSCDRQGGCGFGKTVIGGFTSAAVWPFFWLYLATHDQ